MLEKLMDSPIAWTILAVITIVSLIYAIVCQQKNKEKKEFSYCLKSNYLIRKKKTEFEKLSITYGGQQIEDLCVSKFTIWNSGNRTLNNNDMVEDKELTISVLDNSKILDAELIAYSEETNKFYVEVINEHTVKIYFEYVDKKEGVVIQIIHTGTNDAIQIDCKIKGGKQIKNIVNETVPKNIGKLISKEIIEKFTLISIGIPVVLFFILSIFCVLSIFNTDLQTILLFPIILPPHKAQFVAIVTAIVSALCSTIIGVMYIPLFKKIFSVGIPKKLKKYLDFKN